MKKVLGITNSWPPKAYGHGLYFYNTIKSYPNLTVIGPPTGDAKDNLLVPILKYSALPKTANKITTALKQIEIILRPILYVARLNCRPNMTIASQVLYSGLACFLIKLIFGIPYVVFGHGEEFSIFYKSSNRIKYYLAKIVLMRSAKVICNSQSTTVLLANFYSVPSDKCVVIYPTLNIKKTRVDDADIQDLRRKVKFGCRNILMVGRLSERRKGFDIAIESFKGVLSETEGVKMIIVGPGDPKHLFELIVRHGLTGDIEILGKLPENELMAAFSIADIFLMPNRALANGDLEGFGMVFLEANAFGKPVIGGNSGGVVEAIEHGVSGILVDSEDPNAVKNSIVGLLKDDSMREKLGRQGQERVVSKFNDLGASVSFKRLVDSII
jgi:phosphatidylinositol alpha-1,6-mannosyltransferase